MSANESDDYKRGWNDGFTAAKKSMYVQPMPVYPVSAPVGQALNTCFKCGMAWSGAMGYYCPKTDCPIQPKAT